MTSISLEVPIVGQKNTSEEPKVGNSITTIQSFINGANLDGTTNIKAEGITEANLTAAVVTKLNQKSSGLELKKQSGSTTGESGIIYLMETNAATLTLTATATINKQVGIICNKTALSVKLKAGVGAKIFGDFLTETGVTECTIATNQHVIVEADGTNWFIIAGEPKREQLYVASVGITTGAAETGITPSTVRPAVVTIETIGTAETNVTAEYEVGGKVAGLISAAAITSGGLGLRIPFTVFVPPGQKWQLKAGSANISSLNSYTILQ